MEPTPSITLVSHHLCPYVQRAAIALAEKGIPFDRVYVDLADKPVWFTALSPLGKVPVLRIAHGGGEEAIFESAVILEYLEETQKNPLHPRDPLKRARHRGWIEFGSAMLNAIARLYNARDEESFDKEACNLVAMARRLESELERHGQRPWFDGERFSLVDAVYAPVFRYFDSFESEAGLDLLEGLPRLAAWRDELAARPSVRDAVPPDYRQRLAAFLRARNSVIMHRMAA